MAMDTFFSRMDKDANICTSVALFSKSGCHSVYGLGGSVKTSFTARGIEKRHASALIIVPNKEALQDWKMDLSFFAPSYPVYEFPLIDRAVFTTTAKSMDRSARAMEALVALRQDTPCIVVATIDEVAQLIVSPQALDEGAVSLRVDDEVNRQQLIERLVSGGYERVDMVERRGHFSIRGDIVDIFAVNYEQPLRLAFLEIRWKACGRLMRSRRSHLKSWTMSVSYRMPWRTRKRKRRRSSITWKTASLSGMNRTVVGKR